MGETDDGRVAKKVAKSVAKREPRGPRSAQTGDGSRLIGGRGLEGVVEVTTLVTLPEVIKCDEKGMYSMVEATGPRVLAHRRSGSSPGRIGGDGRTERKYIQWNPLISRLPVSARLQP